MFDGVVVLKYVYKFFTPASKRGAYSPLLKCGLDLVTHFSQIHCGKNDGI